MSCYLSDCLGITYILGGRKDLGIAKKSMVIYYIIMILLWICSGYARLQYVSSLNFAIQENARPMTCVCTHGLASGTCEKGASSRIMTGVKDGNRHPVLALRRSYLRGREMVGLLIQVVMLIYGISVIGEHWRLMRPVCVYMAIHK